jgi:hypothetical protein
MKRGYIETRTKKVTDHPTPPESSHPSAGPEPSPVQEGEMIDLLEYKLKRREICDE